MGVLAAVLSTDSTPGAFSRVSHRDAASVFALTTMTASR